MSTSVFIYSFFGVELPDNWKFMYEDNIAEKYASAVHPNCRMSGSPPSYKDQQSAIENSGCELVGLGNSDQMETFVAAQGSVTKETDACNSLKCTMSISGPQDLEQLNKWTDNLVDFCRALQVPKDLIQPRWMTGWYISF